MSAVAKLHPTLHLLPDVTNEGVNSESQFCSGWRHTKIIKLVRVGEYSFLLNPHFL